MLIASDILSLEEMQSVRRRSDWHGAFLILHAWALILGSMALFAWWPNPLPLSSPWR